MDLALSWSGLLLKAGCLSNVHHFQQSSKFALQRKKNPKVINIRKRMWSCMIDSELKDCKPVRKS